MATTLVLPHPARFSETARSGPCLGETGRHNGHRTTLPIGRRRLADDVVERAAERAQAGEPDIQADVGHAALRRAEQEHRPLDATADRKSTRLNSSHVAISYAVFCSKKKRKCSGSTLCSR